MRSPLLLPSLLLMPLLCGCVLHGKRQFILDHQKTSNVRFEPVDIESYAAIYAEDDGVYLYRENYLELVDRGTSLLSYDGPSYHAWHAETMRYLILNPEADELTTFDLDLDPGMSLQSVHINIFDPDGTIKQLTMKDMNVETDSDGAKRYRVAYPDIVRGSVVDIGYETVETPTSTGNFHHALRLQYALPCERLRVQVVYPKSWFRYVKIRGGVAEHPDREEFYRKQVDEEKEVVIAAYDAHDIPALYNEPWSPYRSERLRYLETSLTNLKGSPITYTWSDYAEKLRDYYIGTVKPRHVRVEIDREDDEEKTMRAILAWINDNIRLKSLDRSIPYDPIEVIERGEGRPQEITILAGLMMINAGIDTEFLLIHSAFDPPVDMTFVVPGRYYTPGLRVSIGDSTLLLFPWITNYPVGYIPSFLQDQPMLVFSYREFLQHDRTGTGSQLQDITTSEYSAEIDESGHVSVVEKRKLEGESAFFFRRKIENLDDEELQKEMKELVVYEGGEVDFERYEIDNRDDFDRPLVITLRYTIDGLVTVTPDEAIVRIEELFSPSFSYTRKVETSERKNPIRIYTDEKVNKTIKLQVPETWQVGPLPEDLREETSFGIATASYSYRPGELTATYSRTLRRSERPAGDYAELLKITGKNSKLNLSTLVFTY